MKMAIYHNSYYDENDRNLDVPDWDELRRRTYIILTALETNASV